MKYAVLLLGAGDTDNSPRNEYVIDAETKEKAVKEAKWRRRVITGKKYARAARVRRLSEEELAARSRDYMGYMNGGYLKYFDPYTGEGYLD